MAGLNRLFHIKCVCTVIFLPPSWRSSQPKGRDPVWKAHRTYDPPTFLTNPDGSRELTISPRWWLRCQLVNWKSPDSKGKCWRHLRRHCAVLSVVVGVKVFVTCLQLPRRTWQRTVTVWLVTGYCGMTGYYWWYCPGSTRWLHWFIWPAATRAGYHM